jgi:hypothetical protein
MVELHPAVEDTVPTADANDDESNWFQVIGEIRRTVYYAATD